MWGQLPVKRALITLRLKTKRVRVTPLQTRISKASQAKASVMWWPSFRSLQKGELLLTIPTRQTKMLISLRPTCLVWSTATSFRCATATARMGEKCRGCWSTDCRSTSRTSWSKGWPTTTSASTPRWTSWRKSWRTASRRPTARSTTWCRTSGSGKSREPINCDV